MQLKGHKNIFNFIYHSALLFTQAKQTTKMNFLIIINQNNYINNYIAEDSDLFQVLSIKGSTINYGRGAHI